jgi:hypothetical protein
MSRYQYPHANVFTLKDADTGANVFVHNVLDGFNYVKANNTDWRRRIKRGENVSSYYSCSGGLIDEAIPGSSNLVARYVAEYDPVTLLPIRYVYFKESLVGFARAPKDALNPSGSLSGVQNAALSRAHKRITAEVSHLNGWTVLGELKETIAQLRRPAGAIRDLMNKYLRSAYNRKARIRNIKSPIGRKEYLDALSGTWLEISFGLKPLLSDTKEIAEALARYNMKPPKRTRIRASALEAVDEHLYGSVNRVDGFNSRFTLMRDDEIRRYENSCQYIVVMDSKAEVPSGPLRSLTDVLGFTPENFVPALYQVAPWSWLLDYFTNVGDIIEAGCTNQTRVLWHNRTSRSRVIRSWKNVIVDSAELLSAYQYEQVSCSVGALLGSGKTVTNVMTRQPGGKLGIPDLVFDHPGDKPGKLFNILAVMNQHRPRVEF